MIVVPGSRKSTWITPPAPKNTVAASFSTDTRVLLSCAGTPQTDTCIRIINVAPTFLLLSPCREEKSHIRFLSEIKLQENVKSLSFHICREHGEERICTNLPVFKNISNVIHTFLWNANFTSKISLSDQTNFFFDQFINPSPAKFIGCCYRSSNSLSHKSDFAASLFYICSHNDAQCSVNIRTITKNNLHISVNLGWSKAFCSPKLNHGTPLKSRRVVSSPRSCFMQNKKRKTFQPSDLPPTDVLAEVRRDCMAIFCRYYKGWVINVNKNPTRCNSMQIFIYCKVTLHVSSVTAPIIRSTKNCNRSLRYRS